jgi:hypothetical protein
MTSPLALRYGLFQLDALTSNATLVAFIVVMLMAMRNIVMRLMEE